MASLSKREHDELRSWLVQRVAQMLGYPDSSVVSAAMQCVQKGYDSKSTTGRRCSQPLNLCIYSLVHNISGTFNFEKRQFGFDIGKIHFSI